MDRMLDPPDEEPLDAVEEALADDLNGNSDVLDGLLAAKEAMGYVGRMRDEMGLERISFEEAVEWLGL